MIFKNKKILVVAAHPDDETLGCGGTIYLASKQGCEIKVIFLGEGVSTRFPNKEFSQQSIKAKKIREKEAISALKILNVKNYEFGSKLCTQFDKYPLINFVRTIEKEIKTFRPNIIFTHCNKETNIDHNITYNATMIACRPLRSLKIEQIFSFETVCSGNFFYKKRFNPNVYVDIKKSFKKKIKAMKSYKKELRIYPHPRSIKGLEIQARFRGMQSGLEFAEGFKLERSIILNDN